MSRIFRALLLSLLLFSAACEDQDGPSAAQGSTTPSTTGEQRQGTGSPSASSSCGPEIGGDAVSPICASPDPSSSGFNTELSFPGPVGPDHPNNIDHVVLVTVSGDGAIVGDFGEFIEGVTACANATCTIAWALGSSGRGNAVLSPSAGFHVWNPATGTDTWPAGLCGGAPGTSSCSLTIEPGDPGEQYINVVVQADDVQPSPSEVDPTEAPPVDPTAPVDEPATP